MADSTKFTKLFEPGTIGKFKIKNRIIRVAAGTDYIDEEAKLKLKPELPYFEALAKGGVGLMIIGATTIYRMEEKHIPGYKALTDMIHKYNIPVFAQHHHGGAWVTRPRTFPPVVSASAIPLEELKLRGPEFPIVPKELTIPEIKEIIAQFATDRLQLASKVLIFLLQILHRVEQFLRNPGAVAAELADSATDLRRHFGQSLRPHDDQREDKDHQKFRQTDSKEFHIYRLIQWKMRLLY